MKNLAFAILTLSAHFSFAISSHCSDFEAIVTEGVAYHLTGAPTSNLPNNCAKKMKWKYFDPNIEIRSEDAEKVKLDYTWFDPKKDTYKIEKVRPQGKGVHLVDVKFIINKKPISITYTYEPSPILEKYRGVCGTMNHREKPWIFRIDCQK